MPDDKPLSVRVVCLGWHWYPYKYSKTRDDCDRLPCKPFPFELGSLAQKALAVTLPHYQQVFQPDDCNRQLVQQWRKTGNASRQERVSSSAKCW